MTISAADPPERVGDAKPPAPRTVYDLKRHVNRHGEENFVEKECESTGRPVLWYKFDSQKNYVCYGRDVNEILCTNLGKTALLC